MATNNIDPYINYREFNENFDDKPGTVNNVEPLMNKATLPAWNDPEMQDYRDFNDGW